MGLDLAPRRLTLISACAPQSRRPEEERSAFAEALGEVTDRHLKKGPVLVLGDLNARLHAGMHGWWPLGPHIYGAGVSKVDDPDRVQSETTNRELLMEYLSGQRHAGHEHVVRTVRCEQGDVQVPRR